MTTGREPSGSTDLGLIEDTVRVGDLDLALLRPAAPDALLDEQAFAVDEFMPYWAELWPAGLELARALPSSLDGLTVLELGAGLGVPALVAASRGATATAVDWAADAVALLERNAARNGIALTAVRADWRTFVGTFDLVLAADVLYEHRNLAAILEALPGLAREVILAEPGRTHAREFFQRAAAEWHCEAIADRVYRLTARHPR